MEYRYLEEKIKTLESDLYKEREKQRDNERAIEKLNVIQPYIVWGMRLLCLIEYIRFLAFLYNFFPRK